MQGGDADEFIDFMNDGEAYVRHKSYGVPFFGAEVPSGKGH